MKSSLNHPFGCSNHPLVLVYYNQKLVDRDTDTYSWQEGYPGKAKLVTTYRIAIKGILDAYWREWLSPYVIRVDVIEDGNSLTVLTVQVPDQAALRGILCRIWDFNLFLVSVMMESGNNLQN
jgi:hypothetical protein